MKNRLKGAKRLTGTLLASLAVLAWQPSATWAQTPVDENGEIIGTYEVQNPQSATGNEEIPLLSAVELEELIGPIALYPDDLLAIVLPASAYPLQIVDAARFLEALENDPSLEPDPEWDDSIVALINYPEVVELLNEDMDWTWRLGEAVVSQQSDVVAAVETFRDRAYAAGNLKSDTYQNVSRDDGVIEITPVADDVIYVPYYEPERVVVYQPRPVYYYYPRAYPVYYYPYSSSYRFDRGYFWGLTTAFTIGWYSDSLHVFHHSYYGHPYFGRSYWDRWWYRRPSVNIHNHTYVGNNTRVTVNRYYGGDRWRPRDNRRDYVSGKRMTRNRYYPRPDANSGSPNRAQRIDSRRQTSRSTSVQREQRRDSTGNTRRESTREQIAFRKRPQSAATNRRDPVQFRSRTERTAPTANSRDRSDRRQQVARTTPERADVARQHRRQPQQRRQTTSRQTTSERRVDKNTRRSEPTPKLSRAEPTVRQHRAERAPRTRQAEPQRQRTAEKKSTRTAQARKSSKKSSARSSDRKSSRRAENR